MDVVRAGSASNFHLGHGLVKLVEKASFLSLAPVY